MKIVVLGSGGWGTALAAMLAKHGHDVTLWAFLESEYETLCRERENRQFLAGVKLPDELKFTCDISAVKGADIVVMATPSFAVGQTAANIKEHLSEGTVIVNVSKGIDKVSGKRLSEIIEDAIGGSNDIVALSGPSHAEEVGRGVPTAIIAASRSKRAAEIVQDAFMNETFRVYITSDIVGVELGGALKNVIALAAGICDGMKAGDNTKAALMTRGLAEMARLGVALGGKSETFAGLAGVGDLIVTCTSMHSRNRRAGIMIGEGVSPQEAVERVGAVVEGYYATNAGKLLADKAGVEMPITEQAYKILYEGKSPETAISELMTRNRKCENEGSWMEDVTL